MSGRGFVRSSKYRHVYGTANKRDLCYEGVKASRTAWDNNVVKVNPLFLAVNWETNGGGASRSMGGGRGLCELWLCIISIGLGPDADFP